jgi:hypothetical protein
MYNYTKFGTCGQAQKPLPIQAFACKSLKPFTAREWTFQIKHWTGHSALSKHRFGFIVGPAIKDWGCGTLQYQKSKNLPGVMTTGGQFLIVLKLNLFGIICVLIRKEKKDL